ncbi:MAG: hypothetical protein COC01_00425 [Bacteroidetes bacterium]|nr:hypothetical protein [Bacteroidia bacterium]PCH69934.1 MAG: hypothetical protein COC01_00425 [Bacteroidota bacterium]
MNRVFTYSITVLTIFSLLILTFGVSITSHTCGASGTTNVELGQIHEHCGQKINYIPKSQIDRDSYLSSKCCEFSSDYFHLQIISTVIQKIKFHDAPSINSVNSFANILTKPFISLTHNFTSYDLPPPIYKSIHIFLQVFLF